MHRVPSLCPGMPENHVKEKHEPRQCYAAWQKDRKERKYSASGGIAFGFYKRWIQNAGIVYGAAFNEKGILTQQKAETLEEQENSEVQNMYRVTMDSVILR